MVKLVRVGSTDPLGQSLTRMGDVKGSMCHHAIVFQVEFGLSVDQFVGRRCGGRP